MLDYLIRVAIIAVVLLIAVMVVPGVEIPTELWQLGAVALIFGVVNAYLRPIAKLLSLPLTLVGLGIIGLVINTGLVLLVAFVSGELELGFSLAGWPPGDFDVDVLMAAFLTALLVSLVSTVLGLVRTLTPGM
ncbi:MAG TPA: phage holin family protein [Candidatus Limnocylindria bacterium]|nr:phage holin family protein [Candidatus Limnocylindria bacterium]